MGQTNEKHFELSKRDIEASERVLSKFNKAERTFIEKMFKDLAMRSPGPTIDRETFTKTFELPGLCGEQLFNVFDFKHTGVLDYLEFVTGLALVLKGNPDEKLEILFRIFDLSSDGRVSRKELETMFLQISNSGLEATFNPTLGPTVSTIKNDSSVENKQQRISAIINNIFEEFDVAKTGYLQPQQFRDWIRKDPTMVKLIDSVFSVVTESTRSNSSRSSSFASTSSDKSSTHHLKDRVRKIYKDLSKVSLRRSTTSELRVGVEEVSIEGELYKTGRFSSFYISRYFVLRGNLLTYFHNFHSAKDLSFPKGVIMLTGCHVEALEGDSVFSFEISMPYMKADSISSNNDDQIIGLFDSKKEENESNKPIIAHKAVSLRKVFYCSSEEERDIWVKALKKACKERRFQDFYELKEPIGSGKFATVYKCILKDRQEEYAVKLLHKEAISAKERQLLRTEISILRLVNHENVVKLVDVFDDDNILYIVTELISGGELFEFISGRNRFSEAEAFFLLAQLLEGVDYLHSAGIIHRDIKPENILLQLEDSKKGNQKVLTSKAKLKLTDFGLSQLVFPEQTLNMPCGTISYVAPEVLRDQGYEVSADLWSIGVILYLVVRGKLPFDADAPGEMKIQMLEKLEQKNILFTDEIWRSVDVELVDLIKTLLSVDPKFRKTAAELKTHPWMMKMRARFPEVKVNDIIRT